MRPGQAAPVFQMAYAAALPTPEGFNEAGAGCPGIRGRRSGRRS